MNKVIFAVALLGSFFCVKGAEEVAVVFTKTKKQAREEAAQYRADVKFWELKEKKERANKAAQKKEDRSRKNERGKRSPELWN